MQIIIFGVLWLRLWQAGAEARGSPSYQDPLHGPGQISSEPTTGSEYVTKGLTDPVAGGGTDYIGVLVDTSPIRRQAGPAGPPRSQMAFLAPPPPFTSSVHRPQYAPSAYPPRAGQPRRGPPRVGFERRPDASDMFKLEAYLTKEGKIVNGQLMSVHDVVHVDDHQYIAPRPGGVALNRPRPPADPYAAHHPTGATLHRPDRRPLTMAHDPYARPGAAIPPGYGLRPLPRPPPGLAPPPPLYPQQGHLNRPELNAIVDNIVASSVGPNGEQVSPQLVEDIVNLLNGEMLSELAEALLNDNRQGAAEVTGTAQAGGDPANSEAFSYLKQIISEQIKQKMGPILQQVSIPT